MTATKPVPIFRSAALAWRDGLRAIGAMKGLAAIAGLIILVFEVIQLTLQRNGMLGAVTGPVPSLAQLALGIAEAFLCTPLAIAVHRYVLLGETAGRYSLDPTDSRFRTFFGFTVVMELVWCVPDLLMRTDVYGASGAGLMLKLTALVLFVVVCVVAVRNVILFPATAVDAPAANWRNAMQDTKGHSWRTLFVLLVVLLPAFVFTALWALPLLAFAKGSAPAFSAEIVAFAAVNVVVQVASSAALIAAASKLYGAFADRLGRPAGLVLQEIR